MGSRGRHGFWKWARRIAAGLAVVVLAGLGGGYLWMRTSLPRTDGTIALAGLAAAVEVARDKHGIPRITARSEADAYFALGFVHAQDRFFQMEFMRRLGAGRLSELIGTPTLPLDRRMRVLGLYRLAEASAANLSPGARAGLDAYAAGVNAYLATHGGMLSVELSLMSARPEPWRPADSLVWARIMGLRLSGNMIAEALRARLAKTLSPAQIDDLWPDVRGEVPPTIAARRNASKFAALVKSWPEALAPVTASNSWVVSGAHTETGRPILANDPHLGFQVPGLWYLARIDMPGLSLTGATVPGVPMTILGHNQTIAWGFTTTESDTQDLFIERVDPGDPTRYLTPDGPRPFEVRSEKIKVRGDDPVTLNIRTTRHGPVISDLDESAERLAGPGHVIAIAAASLREDDMSAEAVWRLNRARSWPEFDRALSLFHAPQQNVSFADIAGNIGFIAPGRVPIRRSGDGRYPVPGWTGAHDWTGFVPYDGLPKSFNPASGRIVNANHPVVGPDYPYHLGHGGTPPYRAQRIHALLDAGGARTPARAGRMQNDSVSLAARELLPVMLAMTPSTAGRSAVLDRLRGWDAKMDRDRAEPLIFVAWLRALNRRLYRDETGEVFREMWRLRPVFVRRTLRGNAAWCDDVGTPSRESCALILGRAFDDAMDELSDEYGDDPAGWRWGAAHYAHFRHPVFGWFPVLKHLADIRIESDGGAFTVNRAQHFTARGRAPYASVHGPGYRAVYDLADLDRSLFMQATGQSGNLLSRHYGDLTLPWRDGRYVRIAPIAGAGAADGVHMLRLTPKP